MAQEYKDKKVRQVFTKKVRFIDKYDRQIKKAQGIQYIYRYIYKKKTMQAHKDGMGLFSVELDGVTSCY